MINYKYQCPKCGNRKYDIDEFRATGGFWTKGYLLVNQVDSMTGNNACSFCT